MASRASTGDSPRRRKVSLKLKELSLRPAEIENPELSPNEKIQAWQEAQENAGGAEPPNIVSPTPEQQAAKSVPSQSPAVSSDNSLQPPTMARTQQGPPRLPPFKQGEEWRSLVETKIRLTRLWPNITTATIYSSLSTYGTVIKVDIDKNGTRLCAIISFRYVC